MTLIGFNSELDFENQGIQNSQAACDSKCVWCVIGSSTPISDVPEAWPGGTRASQEPQDVTGRDRNTF